MAIKFLNTAATKKYVSPKDGDYSPDGNHGEGATVWHLGAMDNYIEGHIQSKATDYTIDVPEGIDREKLTDEEAQKYVKVNVDMRTMAFDTCKFCIRGWDNAQDHNGNLIEYKTKKVSVKGKMYDVVDPDLLAKIPSQILMELFREIESLSRLTEEESKNSATG